jgi:hypothetical protein
MDDKRNASGERQGGIAVIISGKTPSATIFVQKRQPLDDEPNASVFGRL